MFSFNLNRRSSKGGGQVSKYGQINKTLDLLIKNGLYPKFRVIEKNPNSPISVVENIEVIQFASNNYLSLSNDKEVISHYKKAVDVFGIGPGGSRVVNGNLTISETLEKKIADLLGVEDAITFPTGYMANIAAINALTSPLFFSYPFKSSDSVIFSDEYNHGSIIDGCKMTKAEKIIYKHNNLEDLELMLRKSKKSNKLVITEGVYSTEGEVTDVRKYVELSQKYGAMLMVDDAHGIGILGERGGGVAELQGCSKDVDIWMGSFDKAFGSTGGYLAGSKALIDYFRVACRPSIFSSSLAGSITAGMIKAIDLSQNSKTIRIECYKKASYLREKLVSSGFKVLGDGSLTVLPILIGDEKTSIKFTELMMIKGFYTMAFRWPAVPKGLSRIRVVVMHDHDFSQLDAFSRACEEVGRELGIIK